MRWVFAAIGFLYFRLMGAVIGYLIGAGLERAGRQRRQRAVMRTQLDVVENLLVLAVALARADGELHRNEVRAIRMFFERNLGFRGDSVDWLRQRLKHEAEHPGDWRQSARELRGRLNPMDLSVLLRVLLAVAAADGRLHSAEQALLRELGELWGLGSINFGAWERGPGGQRTDDLAWAREVLGVPTGAGRAEIDKAYKRLVREKHPDRFAHLGDELMQAAHEQFVEVQQAYEILKRSV